MKARADHLRVLHTAAPGFAQPEVADLELVRQLRLDFASDLMVALIDAFGPGEPATLYEAQIVLDERWQLAEAALQFLEDRRIFSRVRDGLWVKNGAVPDPYRIGSRITFPYAFALGSALALHTGHTERPARVFVTSPDPFVTFRYRGVVYKHVGGWVQEQVVDLPAGAGWPAGEKLSVTTVERTLIDHAHLHGLPRVAAMLLELNETGGSP